jgi:DinB superfamily
MLRADCSLFVLKPAHSSRLFTISGANERSLTDLLNEFQAVRRATMALFAGLPREAWSRRGTVNRYSVTVRGLAFHIAGHELHHLKILREKYLR